MKTEIIERLGQTDLLLPSLVAEGLAANDRVKARLSVLQAAGGRARDPTGVRFDLTDECRPPASTQCRWKRLSIAQACPPASGSRRLVSRAWELRFGTMWRP